MFAGKTRSLPKSGAPERYFYLVLVINIQTRQEGLPGTNNLLIWAR
jgi:hypothetical protein